MHINVGDLLVFAEEGKVENDLKRLDVSTEDNEISNTSVEDHGSLIGTVLHLLVESGLVSQVE